MQQAANEDVVQTILIFKDQETKLKWLSNEILKLVHQDADY